MVTYNKFNALPAGGKSSGFPIGAIGILITLAILVALLYFHSKKDDKQPDNS